MPKKILIIDDDKDLILLLSRKLSLAGYDIVTALDGIQGTQLALKESPDLVVLDVKLPGGGGIETLKKLRGIPKTWTIPIIIITAYDHPQIRHEFHEQQIDAFIKKPFTDDVLLEKIKEAIRE